MFAVFLIVCFISFVQNVQEFSDSSTQAISSLNSAKGQLTFYQIDFSFHQDKDIFQLLSELNKEQFNINLKFPKEIILPPQLAQCDILSVVEENEEITSLDCFINQFSNSVQFNIDGSLINLTQNSIIFGQVANPLLEEMSSDFELCINNNTNQIICQYRFGKQSFSEIPSQMKSAQVSPLSWNTIGAGASYSFKFELMGQYLGGHSIRIIFPKYFQSKQAYVQIQDTSCEKINSNLQLGRIIECRIIQSGLKGLQQIDIINMINPSFAGYIMGFQIDLLKYNTNIILETISFDGQIQIQPGSINAILDTVIDKSIISFGIPIYYLTLRVQNQLNNGYIEVQLDSQWIITTNTCTIIQIQDNDVTQYSCNLIGNTFKIATFQNLSSQQTIILQLPITPPSIQGQYNFIVRSKNLYLDKLIDESVISTELGSKMGSPQIFRMHPMRESIKLKAGEIGSLELLLFLNVELPATTFSSIGKLVITITPKIFKPILLQNGILKCLFYERVMASKCIFDDLSLPDKTIITIYTPSNFSFYNSEIPIIITSEGAIPGYQEGIKVNGIIQRYQFTIQTFNTDDPIATPLEIYFGEWIPDSKELVGASITPLGLEQSEILVLQIDFICPVDLVMSSSLTNYAFVLNFEQGIQIVLPPGQNSFDNYSCYLEGLVGDNARCDLFQDRLEIYGFQTLLQGQAVRIIISEIPISPQPHTILSVLFSIIQITPGMSTRQIELYFVAKQWNLFSQSQTTVQNMNYEVSVLQSSAAINSLSSYDISYSMNLIDHVLYYFSDDFTYLLTTYQFTCGTSICYYLPISQPNTGFIILQKKQQPIITIPPNYNQLTDIPLGVIQSPPYSGSFLVRLYSLMLARVVSKAYFFIKFGSDNINIANFSKTNPTDYIIKNTEHYFTVSFVTQNYIPDQGKLKIVFKNGVSVQTDRYILYCQLSPPFVSSSYEPVQCSKDVPTNSIFITGFNKISSGVLLQVILRLLTDAVADPINPLCDIFTLDKNDNPIDSATDIPNINNPIANNINPLSQFDLIDTFYQQNEYPYINYIGPFFLEFQQSATIKGQIQTIQVKFDSGFTLPNNIVNDGPVYCQINKKRVYCNVSAYSPNLIIEIKVNSNPAVTIDTNPLNLNELMISTEYVSPLDGIQHPSIADIYQIQLKIIDTFGNSNLSTKYSKINPNKLIFFYVKSFCNTPGQYNLLLFHAKFPQIVKKFSDGGRIYLVFPTQNLVGTILFDLNLGLTYDELIDNYVACNFPTSKNTVMAESGKILKCRLKPKDQNGDSIRIEIINFDNIQINQEVYLYLTKIKNPVNQIIDITFGIEVLETNQYQGYNQNMLNQDQFNVFMNLVPSIPNADLLNPYNGNIFKMPSSVGDINIPMISNRVYYLTPFNLEDLYVVELPNIINPSLNFDGCDSTQFQLCLSFPDVNWLVFITNTIPALTFSLINDVIVQQIPQSVPQTKVQYYSYVWQNKQYIGRVINTISITQWMQLIGSIKNVFLTLMNNQTPLINSKRVEVIVEFVITHQIPSTGSIVIQFPTDFPSIYSHCQSTIQAGSNLFSKYILNNGNFGCTVQNNLQWVISNINSVQQNEKIKIYGEIDLPQGQVTSQSLQITTLSTSDSTNTLAQGFIIDQVLNAPNTVINMSTFNSMRLKENKIVDQQQDILKSGFRGPLRLNISINSNVVGNTGTFIINLFRQSVNKKNLNGFPYNSNDKYVCGFESKVQLGKKIGCLITSITEVDTNNDQNSLKIQLLPNEQLNLNERYELILTSLNGISQEGIQFGLQPGTFKISVSCDSQGLGTFLTINHIYMQIYSNDFQQILFQSLINISGEWNLILLKMSPQTTINIIDQIIIEFPVISLDSKNLFDEDGGYSQLQDSDEIKFDLVDASPSLIAANFSMICKFYKGFRLQNQNLKFICSDLSQPITNTDFIQIAFQILNPSIPANNQLSIPIQIYTYDIVQEIKTHYRHEINAIPILSPGMIDVTGKNGDFDLGGSQETVCHHLVTTFHFRCQQTLNLKSQNSDVYLVKFKFPLFLDQPVSMVDCQYNIIVPVPYPTKCAILVNNQFILVFPSTISGLMNNDLVWINNQFFTPRSKLENAAQRVVIGFAYYSSRRLTEKIIYFDEFPKLLTQKSSSVKLQINSRGNIQPFQKIRMDYLFTITAPYWGIVKKVAIVFPILSNFQFKQQNCKEDASSEVEIEKCEIDPVNQIIWITIVSSTSLPYFIGDGVKKLAIETLSLSMVNPIINTSTFDINYNYFDLQFYSWFDAPLTPLTPRITDDYICFSDDKSMTDKLTLYADKAGIYPDMPKIFDYIHQQYFDEFVAYDRTQRMPLKVELESPENIAATVWNASHKMIVHYGTGIQIPTPSTSNDLLIDSLICYINNQRVRCINDDLNKQIVIEFIEAQPLASNIFIYLSSVDPNNLEKDGFYYVGLDGTYSIKYELQINGGNNYFLYSDFFSAFYSTANQPITPPHRGIENGSIVAANQFKGQINMLEFTLSFDRSDIRGLVFEFITVNQSKSQIYTKTSMHNLQSGSPFPCSKGIPVPDSSPDCDITNDQPQTSGCSFPIKCFIEEGEITQFGKPIRIHAFGFAYTPKKQETFRLLIENPMGTVAGTPIDLLVIVKAYGGSQTFQYVYGNEFKGEYYFLGDISLVDNTPNNLASSPLVPSAAMWQISSIRFTTNTSINVATQSSLIRIVLGDQNEPNICYFAPDQYINDIFYLETQPTPTTWIKYVYAYRTFQISEGSTKIFNISKLRCKHFRYNVMVNHFIPGSLDILTFQLLDSQSITNGQLLPSNVQIQYFDFQTIQINQPSQTLVKINISDLLTSFNPFYGNIISLEFIGTTQTNTIFQNGATSCTVMSGLSIEKKFDHIGEQVKCEIAPNQVTGGIALRLKISNFDTIVKIPFKNSFGSLLPQKDTGLKIRIVHNNSQYNALNALQVIFAYYANQIAYQPDNQQGHVMSYKVLSHTPDYNFPKLTAPGTNKGFINIALNIGTSYKLSKITNNIVGTQENIQMTLNFQTNQDMYIGGDCNAITPCMTCACPQDCISPTYSINRQYWSHWYVFLYGLELNTAQTGCTIDIKGRNAQPNSPFDPEEVVQCTISYTPNGYPIIYIQFFQQFDEMGQILNYKNRPWEIYLTLLQQTFSPTHSQSYVWSRFHIYQERCFNPTNAPSTVLLLENIFQLTTDNLQIGNTPTFGSLTLEELYTTEYTISLNNLNIDIGLSFNTVIQLVFPTYSPNFIFGTDPTKESVQISCLCEIPSGSALTAQQCYRRYPVGLFQASVLLYINVQKGNGIKCYIPEIINPSQQTNLGVLLKVSNPSVYSDYLGKGGFANVYQQEILVNILPQNVLKVGTFAIEPPTFYNSRIVNEQPLVRFAVEVNSATFNLPYIYIRLPPIGPVPTLDFCDSPIFIQNRFFTVQSFVIICQVDQTPTTITVFKGSPQLMAPAKPYTATPYQLNVFVFDGAANFMTHQFQQLIPNTNFQIDQTPLFQVSNIFMSLNVGLEPQICSATFLLNKNLIPLNKGRILLSFPKSSVQLSRNSCFALVEQESIGDLQCKYDSSDLVDHRFWIFRTRADLNTVNNINVYFGVKNNASNNILFTLKFYYSYYSDTYNYLSVLNTFTQVIQTVDSSSAKIFLSFSYMKLYPFVPKIYSLQTTSERFFFNFQAAIPNIQHMRIFSGKVVDTTQVVTTCTLRLYDAIKVKSYQQYQCIVNIFDPTGSPAFEIYFDKVQLKLSPNTNYEFIISTLQNNSIIGFQKDLINFSKEIWMFAREKFQNLLYYTRLLHYYDQGIQQIKLNSLYFTSALQSSLMSMFLDITIIPPIPVGYPTSFITLAFPELTILQSFPTYNPGDIIQCELSIGLQKQLNRIQSPRCVINASDRGQLQIRIEQYDQLSANTKFTVSIDDMLIPAKFVQQWWNMNLEIIVFQNTYKLYFLRVQQLLLIDGVTTTPPINIIGPYNFNPATDKTRGSISDYPISLLNYPINSSYYDSTAYSGFKIRLQFNGGILAANLISNLQIQQTSGTTSYLSILWINGKTNSIYMSAPLISITQQLDLVFKNIINPHMYQQPQYGTSPNIQVSFYQGNNFQRQIPLQSHYLSFQSQLLLTPNIDFTTFLEQQPPLVQIINTPFIIDNQIIAVLNQRVVGQIQFKFNSDSQTLITRKVKRIQIQLIGGFSNIESCWVTTKNINSYLTSFQICKIISADTLCLLDVDSFDPTQDFSLFVQGHLLLNQVWYIFQLQTSDYLPDTTSTLTTLMTQFNPLATIYTELDFIQQKYIFNYYEIAFTSLFQQDITSSLTFSILFDPLLTLNYGINYMEISTSNLVQLNVLNAIMCSFSPLLPTNHLGLTIFSSCIYNTNTMSYIVQSPVGGLNLNQVYVLKITEVVQNSQIQMQNAANNGHELLIFQIKDMATNSILKQDILSLFLLTRWNTISVMHATTTSSFYDVIQLKFSVTKDVIQNTNEEVQLVLQIEGNYYLQDLGITQVYINDNLGQFTSGQRFHCLLTPLLQATPANCILEIGQYANKYDQIRIIMSNIGNILSGTEYKLKVGMVMNPITVLNTLDYTFLILKQRISSHTAEQISQVVYKKRFMSHDYVKDPLLSVVFGSSDLIVYDNINNNIQRSNLGISFSITNTDINDKNQILLKYDNLLNGILNISSVLSSLIVANCEISYFNTINLILLTPLSPIAKPSLFNLGSTYQSQYYYEQWGFQFVYLTESATSKTLFYNNNVQRNTLNIISDLTLKSFTRLSGMPNVGSQNLYQILILTPFIPKEGMITIKLPVEMHFSKSQLSSIKLKQNFGSNYLHSTIRSVYIEVQNAIQIYCFADIPDNTQILIQLLLDNIGSGQNVNIISVEIIGNLKIPTSFIVKSSTVVGVTIQNTPKVVSSLLQMKIRPTYLVIYYTQEYNPLLIQMSTLNSLLVNGNNYLEIVFDQVNALWSFASGIDIVFYMKYYQQLSQIFQGFFNIAANILTLESFPLYDIPQAQLYYVLFNSERAQPNYKEGLMYPKRGVLKYLYLNVRNKGTNILVESSYVEYEPQVRMDNSFQLSVINCYSQQNSRGMKFQLTLNYDISIGDEIRIEFEMNDEITQIFVPYLGFTQVIQQIQCQENSLPKVISSNPLECYLQENQVRIPIRQNIASSTAISFWISNIQNPAMQTVVGVYLKVMTYCRGNIEKNEHRCILYHSKNYYTTKSLPPLGIQYKLQAVAMIPSTNIVSLKATHSYQILFDKAVPALKDILITYPDNHIHTLPCTSPQGQCQILNTRSLIFKPNSPILGGQTVNFQLVDVYNGISLSSHTFDNFIYVEIYDSSTSLIDQAFQIIFNQYAPYQIGITAVISNMQTQNTYLKGSFQNIAYLQVTNIWKDQYINHFVIQKPTIIQGFIEQTFCNSTLLTPSPNPYPLTLSCSISLQGDSLFISAENIPFDASYSTLSLSVYFKLIIDDQFPPLGVQAGYTDDMKIYGCVSSCDTLSPDRYYQTLATTKLYVSDSKVPYFSDILWNQQAFHQSKSVFRGEARFYGVLQPSSSQQLINRLIFNIEDSFQYPPILAIQGCTIYDNQITIPLDACQLKQYQGNSQVEIILSTGYFLSLQPNFILIESLENEFTAPYYPGQHYQIRVSLFENGVTQPSEEIQVFFSRVIGIYFDRSKITFLNALDSKLTNLNEIIFETSSEPIPQGYSLTSISQVHSEIHILFEWIPNGVTIGSGYSNDIGTGLEDGEQIGCLSKSGLTFRENEGILCLIKRAQQDDETSRIRVLNYEQIDPNTNIQLMIIGIESLDLNSYGLIKVAVEIVFDNLEPIVSVIKSGLKSNTYDQEINRSYLYMPSPLIPDKTTAISILSNINPTTLTKTGSTTTLGFSDFEFSFTIGNKNLKLTDYFAIIFPDGFIPNHIIDFSSIQSPQGRVYVFGSKSIIFIQPFVQGNMNTVVTFRISQLPNPYFTIPNGVLTLNAYTFIDRKQDTSYIFTLNGYVNEYNILISNTKIYTNSSISRAQNVRYTIQFQLNQYLPDTGIITLIFPTITYRNLYNLNGFSCYLEGFETESSCQIGGYNKVNVFLDNLEMDAQSLYQIILENIINPGIDLSDINEVQIFQLALYYSTNYLNLNQPFSQVSLGYPLINQISVSPIDFRVSVEFFIYNIESLYTFSIFCDYDIPENTRIVILLGQSYSYYSQSDESSSSIECSSPFILSNICILKYSLTEQSYTLEVFTSHVPPLKSFNLIAKIVNPSNQPLPIFYILKLYDQNSYDTPFATSTVNSQQRQQQTVQFYAQQNAQINQGDQQIFSDSFTLSQNIPNQSNQLAFYIFQISQNNENTQRIFGASQTEILMTLKFPQNFSNMNGYENNLEYFIDYGQQNNKIYTISYVEQLISTLSIQRVSSQDLSNSKLFSQNTLLFTMKIKTEQSNLNSWNYLIVKNVINPQIYLAEDFELKIFDPVSQFYQILFSLKKQLKYEITNSNPKNIMISKIQINSLLFNASTDYVFTIEYATDFSRILNVGVPYLLTLTLPRDQKLKTLSSLTCFIQANQSQIQSVSSMCSVYPNADRSQTLILLKVKFTKTMTSSFEFVVRDLVNPSSSFPSISSDEFSIKIIEEGSSQIIAADTNSRIIQQSNYSHTIFFESSNSIEINAGGPSVIYRGFKNQYQIQIQKPAQNLVITPIILDYQTSTIIQSLFIEIQPRNVAFNNFENDLTKLFTIAFSFNYPATESPNQNNSQHFIIRFQQQQDAQMDDFLNIPDLDFYLQNQIIVQPSILININNLDINTSGYPFFIRVSFSALPASIMYLGLNFDYSDVMYSDEFANQLMIKNKILSIENNTEYEYELAYIGTKIPKPIPLILQITSQNQQIKNIYRFIPQNKFYLVFSKSPTFGNNIGRIQIMYFIPDFSYQVIVGQTIKFKNNPNYSPQIMKVEQQNASNPQTQAKFIVSINQPCKLRYILVLGQEKTEPTTDNFIQNFYDKAVTIGQEFTSQFSDILIENGLEIQVENLFASEYYTIYLMAQNAMGNSNIVKRSFNTQDLSQPCSLYLSFLDEINNQALIFSLSRILRLNPNKILMLSQTNYRTISPSVGFKNSKHVYIIPDEKGSYDPKTLLQNNLNQIVQQLQSYIPQFDVIQKNYIQNKISEMPNFKGEPQISFINSYDATILVETQTQANIFAIIIIQQQQQQNIQPQQIARCIDGLNQQIDQVYCIKTQTDLNGKGIIQIDSLMEGTPYQVYITATELTPYDYPLHLSKQVKMISFTTYQDPNINQCGLYNKMKDQNQKLAKILQKFTEDEYVYC